MKKKTKTKRIIVIVIISVSLAVCWCFTITANNAESVISWFAISMPVYFLLMRAIYRATRLTFD